MDFRLSSSAFREGEWIPSKYSCDGENISPSLKWENFPPDTKSFTLITDDPDAPAGDWVHWVVYNIPSHICELPENISVQTEFTRNLLQGKNDWGKVGYGGPCPPTGIHRYYFKLYSLDIMLPLKEGATKKQLLDASKGHILATAQLMGRYSRR